MCLQLVLLPLFNVFAQKEKKTYAAFLQTWHDKSESRIILQSISKNKIKLYPVLEVARCTSCSRQAQGGFSAAWTGALGCSDFNAKKHSHSQRGMPFLFGLNALLFRGRIALKP